MGEYRLNNLDQSKGRILSYIKMNGPSITMKISNYLKLDSLLTSAFLSELLGEQQLKMSNMKVGNSPIYLIPGQEKELDKFANFLGSKPKEAFNLLKERRVLRDEDQQPAIRVALRSIKDFAFPVEHNGALFWRFFSINDHEARDLIQSGRINLAQQPRMLEAHDLITKEIPAQQIQQPQFNQVHHTPTIVQPPQEIIQEVKQEVIQPILQKPIENIIEQVNEEVIEMTPKVVKPRKRSKNEFSEKIEQYLQVNNISLVNTIKNGKKEYHALVSVDNGENGKKEYFCIAKEKKAISDKELMKNLQIGQKKNLPVLFISSGEMSKKAVEWADYLGNLIVYKKLE